MGIVGSLSSYLTDKKIETVMIDFIAVFLYL